SAPGQRFLSATALSLDPEPRMPGPPAPIARIIGSAQLGVVAAFAGTGLWVARNYVITEVAQPLTVVSILGVSLGLGFVLSAVVAYGMSRQLGLIRSSSSHA